MITDKISITKELINRVQKLTTAANRYSQYKELLTYFEDTAQSVVQCRNMYGLLNRYDPTRFGLLDLHSMEIEVEFFKQQLSSGDLPKKYQQNSFSEKVKSIDDHLMNKWKECTDEKSREAVNILECVKGLYRDKNHIECITAVIKSAKDKWPFGQSFIDSFEKALSDAKLIVQDLDVDQRVQEFLIKVATGNATAEDLDSEIIKWLDNHSFSRNMKITFM